MTYCFVGEERSARAAAMGVRWEDGRLAARSLFQAMQANGLRPGDHVYVNLFEPHRLAQGLAIVRQHVARGRTVVGMGRRVQRELARAGIPHRALVHPAARGTIRRKSHYAAHLAAILRKEPS